MKVFSVSEFNKEFFTVARYQSGNLVVFVNKFERCGVITQIDEQRGGKFGYRLNTRSTWMASLGIGST